MYLALGRRTGKGIHWLTISNICASTLVVVVIALLTYGAMAFSTLVLNIGIEALLSEDPADYLAFVNIHPVRLGSWVMDAVAVGAFVVAAFVVGLAAAAGLLLKVGHLASARAFRGLTRSFDEVRQTDDRPPVLFLRPFHNDQVALPQERSGPFDTVIPKFTEPPNIDQALLPIASLYGPVVAIGRPDEQLPPFGAARRYIDGEGWHEVIRDLALASKAVVIVLDETPGVSWEREMLVDSGLTSKALFLFEPGLSARGRFSLMAKVFPELRESLDIELHGSRWPVASYMAADGTPRVVCSRQPSRSAHIVALQIAFLDVFGQASPPAG